MRSAQAAQTTTQQAPARRLRNIRGPQSALTDFLASHNIDANYIRQAHQRRLNQVQAQGPGVDDGAGEGPSNANTRVGGAGEAGIAGSSRASKKRKIDQQKAIDKIKASKKFQKRKKHLVDSDEEDDLIEELLKAKGPQPGQMGNCDICDVRFTVTPYSRAGPNGGLLCNPCGKELEKEQTPAKKKKKPAAGGPVGRRRKNQSSMLDGTYVLGAKSLMSLCIETLAKNIELAEDLGELPPRLIDRIARMLSKKRLLDPNTLNLFLQPTTNDLAVYDATKLSVDDLSRIFQTVPQLKSLKIKNGVQFKDEVMEYLISRDKLDLEGLHIHGANLLSNEMWKRFLTVKGVSLRTLQVYYTDKHFDDECVALLQQAAPNLRRLKIYHNQKVSGTGIRELAHLSNLQHLSINLHHQVHSDIWVSVLGSIGSGLKTLSLRMVPELDNSVLDAMHANCRSLSKLRITDSGAMTDAGFVRLFSDWQNPGLTFLDLEKCRLLDAHEPRNNPDAVGLCSEGFKALMKHSGRSLQSLNLDACRHISSAAFEEVFSADNTYPELKKLELSFCEEVSDLVVASIFRSCPNMKELIVFGCMKLKDVRVPRGKVLIGMPNALGMLIEG
ncbi:hypothetical protein BD289DRAFT_365548 [Coniella lustricola]|uniref:DNA repair protein rhp7 treble clef domain-containing protein n=1 Tax=Coniella lustricola TaxID=2025994 RepID=A0A2T3AC42_9PEZI|nr:hypothetical protein BD289DRAFT_365548 [Coniella lustricola]